MAAELTFNTSLGVPQPAGTVGINYYVEAPGTPEIEVYRVTSDATGDYFFSRRFKKVKSFMVQNHGATFATGTLASGVDPPKIVLTQGTSTASAKFTITHTATEEVFSIIVIGEL